MARQRGGTPPHSLLVLVTHYLLLSNLLSEEEKAEVVANCAHLARLKSSAARYSLSAQKQGRLAMITGRHCEVTRFSGHCEYRAATP